MEKVVKCNGCGLYFMREGKNIKYCPFCKTEYVEFKEKDTDLPAGRQDKKETARTQNKSFKVWNNN